MPFNIKFPTFNPGVTLTSAPYRPTEQVIGSPANATNLAASMFSPERLAQILGPQTPPPAAATPARSPFGSGGGALNNQFLNASRWSGKNVPNSNMPYMDQFGLTGRGGGSSR
jgi:hypothetical protein